MARMDGLVAIVTGASRGLGRAHRPRVRQGGRHVVICARHQSPTGWPGPSKKRPIPSVKPEEQYSRSFATSPTRNKYRTWFTKW